MKTTIEVSGYEIKIEEMEGKIMVSALQDGEVVEEFELDSEMGDDFDDDEDDMGGMDAFGEEGAEEEEEDEEDFDDEEEDFSSEEEEGKTLESFAHFVKKRKK